MKSSEDYFVFADEPVFRDDEWCLPIQIMDGLTNKPKPQYNILMDLEGIKDALDKIDELKPSTKLLLKDQIELLELACVVLESPRPTPPRRQNSFLDKRGANILYKSGQYTSRLQ